MFLNFAVHFEVSFLNFVTNKFSLSDRFCEELFDLGDLLTDIPFLSEIFYTIDDKLFADHNEKKISGQSRKTLVVKGRNYVTDVGVHELEHVNLVDD